MDLFLMDLILKGKIRSNAKVLDIGCGEGRNGIYFIQQGNEYHGWDTDDSKLKLLEYLAKTIKHSNTDFVTQDFIQSTDNEDFDLVICSRVLHFASSEEDFMFRWNKVSSVVGRGGMLYVSMDSVINTDMSIRQKNGLTKFPDGNIRFALTHEIYQEIKKGFEEVEPLRTLIHHNERAQSFLCFKKI